AAALVPGEDDLETPRPARTRDLRQDGRKFADLGPNLQSSLGTEDRARRHKHDVRNLRRNALHGAPRLRCRRTGAPLPAEQGGSAAALSAILDHDVALVVARMDGARQGIQNRSAGIDRLLLPEGQRVYRRT